MRRQIFDALLITHCILLLAGTLAVAYGVFALRAAERSAAYGGGLLGGIGMIPPGIGLGMLVLTLRSIALVMTLVTGQQETESQQ